MYACSHYTNSKFNRMSLSDCVTKLLQNVKIFIYSKCTYNLNVVK